jgi:hypothetical protein
VENFPAEWNDLKLMFEAPTELLMRRLTMSSARREKFAGIQQAEMFL